MGIPAQREQMNPLAKTGDRRGTRILADDYFTSINTYAYMNSTFPAKAWWWVITGMLPAYPGLLRGLVPLWRDELHPEYQAFAASKKDLVPAEMSAEELWHETQELLNAAAYYMCGLMFATMGASAGSEGLLTRAYNKMAKQDGDPDATDLADGLGQHPGALGKIALRHCHVDSRR